MVSDKQLLANVQNAQKSTGPRTDAGKKRSSLNGIRHGLTGQVVILPTEDVAAHKAFTEPIVADFEPFNATERNLAQQYANYQWRINRAAVIEDNLFGLGLMEETAENLNIEHPEAHTAAANAKTFRNEHQAFVHIALMSQRLVNQAEKVLKQLKQMQAERKKSQRHEMHEAKRLYLFHVMQESPFDPKENGFDLTTDQIKADIRRQSLHSQSRMAEDLDFNRVEYFKELGKVA